MIDNNLYLVICSFDVVYDAEKSPVARVVVDFCWREFSGAEGDRCSRPSNFYDRMSPRAKSEASVSTAILKKDRENGVHDKWGIAKTGDHDGGKLASGDEHQTC